MTTENDFYTKNKDIDFYNFFEVKAEKLITAVYMVTNFLSDKEPMKWKLREACLSMLSEVSVLKDTNAQERSDILAHLLSTVSEVISILSIAHLSGFISEMNYSVLKREFVFIKKQIELRKEIKSSVGKLAFSENFFDIPDRYALPVASSDQPISVMPKAREDRGQNNLPTNYSHAKEQKKDRRKMSYRDQKDNNLPVCPREENNCHSERVNTIKNKRRDTILQILKDKKELTIKDISLKITDCSEKTIQRELVSMLHFGILKKRGERRWSKYSLA